METERVGLVAEPAGRRQPSVVYGEGGATHHSKQLTFLLTIDAGAIGVTLASDVEDLEPTQYLPRSFSRNILPSRFSPVAEGRLSVEPDCALSMCGRLRGVACWSVLCSPNGGIVFGLVTNSNDLPNETWRIWG